MMPIQTTTQLSSALQAKPQSTLLNTLRVALAVLHSGRPAATMLFASLRNAASIRKSKRVQPRGPLPTWLGDPQLSKQLLKDTGLTIEDLCDRPTYDEDLPFFMQRRVGQ